VHGEFLRRFALIAAMARKNFKYVSLLELADGISIRDAGGMHLEDEIIEIAFQSRGFLTFGLEFVLCDEKARLIQLLFVCLR
jgi:hypothetical protein